MTRHSVEDNIYTLQNTTTYDGVQVQPTSSKIFNYLKNFY